MKTKKQIKLEQKGWSFYISMQTGDWFAKRGSRSLKDESLKKLLDRIE